MLALFSALQIKDRFCLEAVPHVDAFEERTSVPTMDWAESTTVYVPVAFLCIGIAEPCLFREYIHVLGPGQEKMASPRKQTRGLRLPLSEVND